MNKYKKIIILSSVLFVIIALITLVMVFDIDMVIIKNLSIVGIENKKQDIDDVKNQKEIESNKFEELQNSLKKAKDNFDVQKQTYENIPSSDIAIVQQATIDEKYFIEYLWVVLGNYAKTNNLKINIITPGASYSNGIAKSTTDGNDNDNSTNSTTNTTTKNTTTLTTDNKSNTSSKDNKEEVVVQEQVESGDNDKIKIVVNGRYANLADFVFDVENDSTLRFKLDNIKMTYSGNNKVEAIFDVLSLAVLN